jgi:hypothetical protein
LRKKVHWILKEQRILISALPAVLLLLLNALGLALSAWYAPAIPPEVYLPLVLKDSEGGRYDYEW